MKSGYSARQKADLVMGIVCLWKMSWWRGAEVEGSEVRSGQRLELFDGCKWTTAQGGVIDLSSIGNKDNTARFPDVPADDKYLYSYNPCYPFQEGTCSAAAVCQMTATKDEYYQAGDATGAELTDYQGKPSIHYKADTDIERNSYVTLICDQSAATPALKALGDISYADYHFELTTVCACPDGCGGGSGPDGPAQRPMDFSIGSILCITMAVYLPLANFAEENTNPFE